MVVLTVLAASGGALIAGAASWKECAKPLLRWQIAQLFRSRGPAYLGGSECDVADVDFSLGRRVDVVVSGLAVRNLPPYAPEDLIKLDKLAVSVDALGAFKSGLKVVGVDSVRLEGCCVSWETGLTSSNVGALLSKLHEADHSLAEKPAAAEQGDASGPKVVVREVCISGVSVVSVLHIKDGVTTPGAALSMPDIHISNFSEQFGIPSLAKFVGMLASEVLMGAQRIVSQELMGKVEQKVEEAASWFAGWFS